MILPYILTLVFLIGLSIIALVLIYAALTGRRATEPVMNSPIPADNLGPAATNRWLSAIRFVFLAICVAALGMHSYWAMFAEVRSVQTRNMPI